MVEAARPVEGEGRAQPVAWPRYVRVLAVGYVLSYAVGVLGFLVLCGVAAFLFTREGPRFDGRVGLALAGAWGCPLACAAFRWWFRSWGRRHWPDAR